MTKEIGIRTIIILFLALAISLNSGCMFQEGGKKAGKTIKIVDMLGRTVELPRNVEKVVAIEAGALRLLVYLECTDKIIGVEDIEKNGGNPYNFAHPELANLPTIGPIHGGDAELIVAQKPDVVFWTYTTIDDADGVQKKTTIPIVALDYGDLDDNRDIFYENLKLIGKVMDRKDRAEELIWYIENTIKDLNDRTRDIPNDQKQKVYVGGISSRGTHGILSTEPQYSPFEYVHVNNVASELGMEHAFVDKEKLIEWNPDIIFVDEGGYSLVTDELKDEAYASIEAVKSGELYGVLPYNFYATNFATVLADAYYIAKVLFPDKFTDVDPEKKADEIYKNFLGKGVHQNMKDAYGGFKKLELEGRRIVLYVR